MIVDISREEGEIEGFCFCPENDSSQKFTFKKLTVGTATVLKISQSGYLYVNHRDLPKFIECLKLYQALVEEKNV